MMKHLLLILFILFAAALYSQDVIRVEHSCNYQKENRARYYLIFGPSPDAEQIVKEICNVVNLPPNFRFHSSQVDNVLATTADSQRIILYNPLFIERYKATSRTRWAAYSVLAHEVGHHLMGHDFREGNPQRRKEMELEADCFSGKVLHLLGASLDEAQLGIAIFASESGSKIFPLSRDRRQSVTLGWRWQGERLRPQTHSISDTDNDGILDQFDHCPTEKGDPYNYGCPSSKPTIRSFPWPPPRCAERYTLLHDFKGRFASLGEVDRWICNALNAKGYWSRSYYSLPNGFALVTRMEQFDKKTGSMLAEPQRWVEYPMPKNTDLLEYLSSLFFPCPGMFRVFVFAVTDQTEEFSDNTVTRVEAQDWLAKGVSVLPVIKRSTLLNDQHFVEVLVYEFEMRESDRKSKLRCPSGMLCPTHLEGAGLKRLLR